MTDHWLVSRKRQAAVRPRAARMSVHKQHWNGEASVVRTCRWNIAAEAVLRSSNRVIKHTHLLACSEAQCSPCLRKQHASTQTLVAAGQKMCRASHFAVRAPEAQTTVQIHRSCSTVSLRSTAQCSAPQGVSMHFKLERIYAQFMFMLHFILVVKRALRRR